MKEKKALPKQKDIQWGASSSQVFRDTFNPQQSEQVPFHVKPSIKREKGASLRPTNLKKKEKKNSFFLFQKKHFILFILSLMLLGVCFFVAGLFCGLWIAHPAPAKVSSPPQKKQDVQVKKKEAKQSPEAKKDRETKKESKTSSTKTEEPKKKRRQQTPKSTNLYVIHFGSFNAKENAQELKKRLSAQNVSSTIKKIKTKGHAPLFKVCSEIGTSYVEAQTIAEGLNQQQFLSAVVIPFERSQDEEKV